MPFLYPINSLKGGLTIQTSNTPLIAKGILKRSGEINKDKITLVAGAVTQPFAKMVWVTTGGDMDTINRLTDVLVTMNTPANRGKLFRMIQRAYGPALLRGSRADGREPGGA